MTLESVLIELLQLGGGLVLFLLFIAGIVAIAKWASGDFRPQGRSPAIGSRPVWTYTKTTEPVKRKRGEE